MHHSHRRFNPLLGEWVLVSPGRTSRPWQGDVATQPPPPPAYDPGCYLCPGNPRAAGQRNPGYNGPFVFDNDFPSLDPAVAADDDNDKPTSLFRRQPESGVCRVVCYSPRHDLTLARLDCPAVEAVVATWTEQSRQLLGDPALASVMVFENRGAMMGASNPHPHGQIWANSHVPNVLATEATNFNAWNATQGPCLLCTYLQQELEYAERIVLTNNSFVAIVPYWALWPFELLVLPRQHCPTLPDLSPDARRDLADILRRIAIRYDNLFQTPFPCSWGFHQAPRGAESGFHMHAHFFPPLLRSASIRKFVVGYELLAQPQRDITAESAAVRLRELSDHHYLDSGPADVAP